jgi:hypothetical protein
MFSQGKPYVLWPSALLFGKAYIKFGTKKKPSKFGDSMNKKTMYIIVAVLIVIIIVGAAAAYVLMNPGNGGTPSPTATPTTAPTVVGASTLQFVVTENTSGAIVNYEFAAKNVNTSTVEVRVTIPSDAGNYTYILNAGTEKSFISMDEGATWTASTFATDWESVGATFESTVTKLVSWNGHDATYSFSTATSSDVVSHIVVNPTLADSLFATS